MFFCLSVDTCTFVYNSCYHRTQLFAQIAYIQHCLANQLTFPWHEFAFNPWFSTLRLEHSFQSAVFYTIVWKPIAGQNFEQTDFKVKKPLQSLRFHFDQRYLLWVVICLWLKMTLTKLTSTWQIERSKIFLSICCRASKKKFDPLAEFSKLAGKLKDKVMNPNKG